MLLPVSLLLFVSTDCNTISPIRTGKAKMIYNSMYIAAYHLHAMGTFPSPSLRNCIYQCQNNDYCRTANYFSSEKGTMCSLFEEYSSVGSILSVSSIMSVVISFDLCPPGFAEPEYICFGVPAKIQPPVTVQQALGALRLVQSFSLTTYHPTILPSINTLYIPVYSQSIVKKFDWSSLKFIANVTAPFPLYSYDTDIWGNLLQSSSSSTNILVSGPSGNWSDSSISYYSAFFSDLYAVVVPSALSPLFILNSTTGYRLFNYTMSTTNSLWARIINHQLYVTSNSGLRRFNLTEGVSASPVLLVANLVCKEIFLDASGRLYVEQNDATLNHSFVFDLNGALIANYTHGSKLIVKASKYSYFVFSNIVNSLLLYTYP